MANSLKILYQIVFLGCVFILGLWINIQPATGYGNKALKDPVVRGAWLYRSYCVRCHGPYENERLGGEFDDEQGLSEAIGTGACEIKWSRRYGGQLHPLDIQALSAYFLTYEDLDSPPELPKLPPPPKDDLPRPKTKMKETKTKLEHPETTMDPVLKKLLEINLLAKGAYLYTQQCYRCHLSYQKTRRGRGFAEDTVRRSIQNGKTSTQMKAFSRMKGGELSNKEIEAIVTYIVTWEKFDESPAIANMVVKPPKADASELLFIGLPSIPVITGEQAIGERLYAKHCFRCHGCKGEGYAGPRLSKHWWLHRPDLYVKSVLKMGIPGTAMSTWSQNKGGPLSAKTIDDMVTLIMSWQRKQ
jgi:mono/diheme cytochrome c family protein